MLFVSVLEIISGKSSIDLNEYRDPETFKQKLRLDEKDVFRSLLLASFLLCLLNLITLLFLTPAKAPALKKPYLKGNALNVLSDVMADDSPLSLELLNTKYDEICFKCLTFRTFKADHCTQIDECVLENHGWSSFFHRSIHLYNFKQYFSCTLSLVIYLSFCIIAIIRWQRVLELESSNSALQLVELHLIGITKTTIQQ